MARKKTAHTKTKMIHVRLNENLHQQQPIQVAKENLTIQSRVEMLIEDKVTLKLG